MTRNRALVAFARSCRWARSALTTSFCRLTFASFGVRSRVMAPAVVVEPSVIAVGDRVFIGPNSYISAHAGLHIGDDTIIGPGLTIVGGNHSADPRRRLEASAASNSPVGIGSDVWIGANVTIVEGGEVSNGCVVGAGSVVTSRLPANTVCAGVPCRPLRRKGAT